MTIHTSFSIVTQVRIAACVNESVGADTHSHADSDAQSHAACKSWVHDSISLCYPFDLTTSTEQCARAETAAETLPSNSRSIPLIPLAPIKMQSAPQVSAASRIWSAGLPRVINTSTCNPALRSLWLDGSKISRTWSQFLSSPTSIHFTTDGSAGFGVIAMTVSTTASKATSVPPGQ